MQFKKGHIPHNFQDLTDQKFGRLTVISYSHKSHWNCVCICGNKSTVSSDKLKSGRTKSCGCIRKDFPSRRTHGESYLKRTPEHSVWTSMLTRCRNKNSKHYNDYGGRGILVCERWLKYENFLSDMGRRPTSKHTLDRKDNNGNYESSNCRWATKVEQALNRRSSVILTHNGLTMNLKQWGERIGISIKTLSARKKRGWSTHKMLETKPKKLWSNDQRQ